MKRDETKKNKAHRMLLRRCIRIDSIGRFDCKSIDDVLHKEHAKHLWTSQHKINYINERKYWMISTREYALNQKAFELVWHYSDKHKSHRTLCSHKLISFEKCLSAFKFISSTSKIANQFRISRRAMKMQWPCFQSTKRQVSALMIVSTIPISLSFFFLPKNYLPKIKPSTKLLDWKRLKKLSVRWMNTFASFTILLLWFSTDWLSVLLFYIHLRWTRF